MAQSVHTIVCPEIKVVVRKSRGLWSGIEDCDVEFKDVVVRMWSSWCGSQRGYGSKVKVVGLK